MRTRSAVLACLSLSLAEATVSSDEDLCREHVIKHTNETWRQASGKLQYPYLVPAGPYNQEWDWDSVFLGVATLSWGSRRYLEGSMMNFFAATDVNTGEVTGCLVPDGLTDDVLYHAKPVLIQGAWLAASAPGGDPAVFQQFAPQMRALLSYWDRAPRKDTATGLRVWHDQMETGADNLAFSECASALSDCWSDSQAFTLASPDLLVFLYREHTAYSLFCDAWASEASMQEAAEHRSHANQLQQLMDSLWRGDLGYHVAYNSSSKQQITTRTYQIALPLWAGMANETQAKAIAAELQKPDLLSPAGLRSTSSQDPRYNNDNIIVPYSNWRGPMWVNANAMACYGLVRYGFKDLALDTCGRVVATLASDLRTVGQWHESYATNETTLGTGLAAPGFLSWDTLSAELLSNIRQGRDPFALEPKPAVSILV